jgi:hypothetical protein
MCQYACCHGYFPESACGDALSADAALPDPPISGLDPFATAMSYGVDDYFVYESPTDDHLGLFSGYSVPHKRGTISTVVLRMLRDLVETLSAV